MNLRQLGLLILLGLIWGASFMFIKVALPAVPPFAIVFVRTALAGLVLYAVVRSRGSRMPPPGAMRVSFLVMGLLNGAVPYSLINWGEVHIETGLGATRLSLVTYLIPVSGVFWGCVGSSGRGSAETLLRPWAATRDRCLSHGIES